jgi:hypothetical protein
MKITAPALAAVCALAAPGAAEAAPANTIVQMFAQLNQCFATLPAATLGTDVTIQFMVNRNGALIGKPRLTHAVWPRDADPRAAAAAIASGLDHCLPLAITDALGGAIAGRLIAYRLRPEPRGQKA